MNGTSEPHARHDFDLVAALAADDLEPSGRVEAEALIARCHDCAELLSDLRSIALATAALPLVPRTRDFRVSAADAARLRPRGWRAILDALGGARATFSRPLATGLTTLGIVGLLVSTIPGALSGISLGGSSAAPISAPALGGNAGQSPATALGPESAPSHAPPAYSSIAPSAAASSETQVKVDLPSPGTDAGRPVASAVNVTGAGGAFSQPSDGSKGIPRTGPGGADAGETATDQAVRDGLFAQGGRSTGPSLILIGSIVCLALGAGLFVVRRLARQ